MASDSRERRASEAAVSRLARSASDSARRKRRLSTRAGLSLRPRLPIETERSRHRARRWLPAAAWDPREQVGRSGSSFEPGPSDRRRPETASRALARRLEVIFEETCRRARSPVPSDGAAFRPWSLPGRPGRACPPCRAPALRGGKIEKLARNLFANGCQMPLELGIGRTVLKYRGSGRGPRPRRDENNEDCPGLS